jgi:hypothetical protein
MTFQKGHKVERTYTQADRDRIWELYFGSKWGLDHIAHEYTTDAKHIASVIDTESERRWREKHPHETNRERMTE